ncbi:MAG: chromosome segregation protein SMC [Firmicutes bacterium]|nr:chromosome segregation protein SMC [Bacillota bacterium]
MYLKEIVTSGFKSFADKLDIKLDDKITCIVGPNGSGKSNVVDAVRWVLGEQSVKSLRGEGSMSDVIFSGSKSRNPLNVASVELIFDNSDHFLNVPYTEISIKRKIYRSGENEYYLNNEKCRLKDLTNLLIDSGMGKESFNIISQGEVEKILSNSPVDRRVIFEEASGILKYKKRKEEALRKLDRTHNNIDRVNDIITELELQVGPLKEQSEKAKIYLENKEGLDKYEVALLAYDIENLNGELENNKIEKEKLDKEILNITTSSSTVDAKVIEDSNKLEKLELEKRDLNRELLEITKEVEKLNGEKNLLKERSKNNKETSEVNEEIRKLLEEKNSLDGKISLLKEELARVVEKAKIEEEDSKTLHNEVEKLKTKRSMLANEFSSHEKEIISTNHKIDSLRREIEENLDLPTSVRNILKETSLTGIHNTIGNVLSIDEKYTKALNIAISASKNFIITTDEESAKKGINYLKDNHLGRATFFPINIIKERFIDNDTLNLISNNDDFIDVLSNLTTFDKKYENIIKNQLGTILVSPDIDSATRLSKIIKNRYKIVTLDGDVVNVGGSMSGGSTLKTKSAIILKQELSHKKDRVNLLEKEKEEIENELQEIREEVSKLEEKTFEVSRNKVTLKEKYDSKNSMLKQQEELLERLEKDLESLKALSNNSIDEKEQKLIEEYHEKNTLKTSIVKKIEDLEEAIDKLKQKIEEETASMKLENSKLRNLEKTSREKEITINRLDVKIDNMLNTLNEEYEMTFEKAKDNYKLDIDPEEARVKVNTYRANIKRIGMVNIDAIEEYEKVNTRYEFLTNQKEDLLKAEDTLLEIMNEMDDVMKEEFEKTFIAIQREFKDVFKSLFGGGNSDLRLTNPDDLLTTGVEIVASPPGKKLTTISLLSGGEKTLTAISLLFAILNVRQTPFCLFDEVEAALDEANVAKFGEYLDNYKNKTQFLIITHKKKTMEYANTLYGITMQESGVSKLVSVKLNQKEDYL